MSTSHSYNQEFAKETWILYGVGMLFITARLIAQAHKLGIRGLHVDDWLIITAIPWYTLLVVSINKIIFGGGSNFMTEEDIAALTPETKQDRINGSKWVMVSEQVMVLTIWTCKICMLLIYRRLTSGLSQERLITGVFVFVIVGFIACEVAFFSNCRPFWGYWTVPAIHEQCWSYGNFALVEGVFNIIGDTLVLLVAIPLFAKLRIPIQQKIMLICIFGMGIFVITAAILTKVYSFVPALMSYDYLKWYFREASVSVYVTNAPGVWSLVREAFPAIRNWGYPKTIWERRTGSSGDDTVTGSGWSWRTTRTSENATVNTNNTAEIVTHDYTVEQVDVARLSKGQYDFP